MTAPPTERAGDRRRDFQVGILGRQGLVRLQQGTVVHGAQGMAKFEAATPTAYFHRADVYGGLLEVIARHGLLPGRAHHGAGALERLIR